MDIEYETCFGGFVLMLLTKFVPIAPVEGAVQLPNLILQQKTVSNKVPNVRIKVGLKFTNV